MSDQQFSLLIYMFKRISSIQFREMTEEMFLLRVAQLDTEELGQYMSHIRPNPEAVLHWFSVEYLQKFIGSFWLSRRSAEVYFGIFLVEDFRGKNIGEFCLKHIISLAYENKIKELFLNVRVSNQRAIGFYEKHGFKRLEMDKNQYGVEYIKMSKKMD